MAPVLGIPASTADTNQCRGGGEGGGAAAAAAGSGGRGGLIHVINKNSSSPSLADMTWLNVFMSCLASASCCLFVIFFKADYVRTKAEKRDAASKILNFCRRGSGVAAGEGGGGGGSGGGSGGGVVGRNGASGGGGGGGGVDDRGGRVQSGDGSIFEENASSSVSVHSSTNSHLQSPRTNSFMRDI